jgi:hypothetical protein
LNHDYRDILVDGQFVQTDALNQETGDEHLAAMPRLVFHFDRKSLGRLRQVINLINESGA